VMMKAVDCRMVSVESAAAGVVWWSPWYDLGGF